MKKRIVYGLVILICTLALSPFLLVVLDPLLFGGLHDRFSALFNPNAPSADLPPQVSISLEGAHATFEKGSTSYNEFINLFRWCRSVEAAELAGPPPPFRSSVRCGELTITYFGLPFHYPVLRSKINGNYFWFAQSHPLGTHYPGIHDDGRFLNFRLYSR